MATVSTPVMRKFADDWENAVPSAVLSGIVGDPQHQAEGGYHISREDQPDPDDYSIQLAEDKEGPNNTAAAVDMNHSPAEMLLVTNRLLASAKDVNDPRLNYTREFYGTVNGKSVQGWDTYYGRAATSDNSHLWHIHISFLRKYVNDPVAMAAVLSVIKGETVAQWQAGGGNGEEMELKDVVVLADGRPKTIENILKDTEQLRNYLIGDGALPAGYPTAVSPMSVLLAAVGTINALATEVKALRADVAKISVVTAGGASAQENAKATIAELVRELTD